MKQNFHFTLFAYSGDDDLILENILCILDCIPGASITVLDDSRDPCSHRTRTLTEILGVRWKDSPCDLYPASLDNFHHVLEEMTADSRDRNDILVKIDPDTVLLDASELFAFARSDKALWACGCPDTHIFGSLFALRADAARLLLKKIHRLEQEDSSSWDIRLRDILLDLYDHRTKDVFSLWWLSGTLLPWARFDWDLYPDVSSYGRHAVVNVGGSSRHGFQRELRGEVMRKLRMERES